MKTLQNKNHYHIATLPNGLRVVVSDHADDVSYIGVAVNAGSRDEDDKHQGLAHFVEHTIFKGTRHRRSWHISNRMESVGGELNAYTTKEETLIYTNTPAGHVDRALELLSDLIMNSVFPPAELDKEREVIIEEIHSYEDSPSDAVYDQFEEQIYRGCGLSHNILGSPESVRALTSQDARSFIERNYTPGNMVIYCVDRGDPEKNLRRIERYFGKLAFPDVSRQRIPAPAVTPFDIVRNEDSRQANTIVGTRLFGRTDPRRYALFLLNNYLGGPCMNSRLNLELRDKRGLVYTVEGNVSLMSDTGLLLFYFGSDTRTVGKCRDIIIRELERTASKEMTDTSFSRIREQYCGQLILSSDHRESRAMSLAKSLLYYNEVLDSRHAADMIRRVTPADLRDMARLVLDSGLSTLT